MIDNSSHPRARLKGISKSYGEGSACQEVLHAIDLDLPEGSLTLLEGPSGSGKSTVLNILGLLDRPDQGEIEIDGRIIGQWAERKLANLRNEEIGFIFQSADLIPRMTALENIRLPLDIRGVARKEANSQVREILDKLNMAELASQPPEKLSGGQRQRVAVARALVTRPKLLIADEPTSSLDGDNARQTASAIQSLCHELGTAVILATHDARLREFADRILHLEDGKLTPDTVTDAAGTA
ncbi:ABC transporter ATP-binding protein [Aestuariispira insulae]|uniref:Putative ABC transport system ATP-binding protein n=1 Tax=Aestuariispira insulae TaxID=1461337 RepID=A0A3D9H3Y5_9PROT|nr:ABC transporter ATP-binding protein [Aestuariispira insulae]RED44198.1 putative ABC transport system ATP-binding protein [Aestuariispira insulae]